MGLGYRLAMLRVPLHLVPDPDNAQLMSCFVDVVVNGQPGRALLDSGSSRSAVVERPGIHGEAVQQEGGGVFGGESASERRARVDLAVAGREFGPLEVSLVPPDHPGYGDLIGQDVLGRGCCHYRLADGEVTFDAAPPSGGHPVWIGRRGHVMMEVTWPDRSTAQAVFDTGAAVTVVDQGFAKSHPQLFAPDGESQGKDADGNIVDTPMVQIAPLSLLGSHFDQSSGALVDLTAARTSAERPMDMILGWPLLSQGGFTIDHLSASALHQS